MNRHLILALCCLLAAPLSWPALAQSTEKIELARRIYIAFDRFGAQMESALLQRVRTPPYSFLPDVYRQAVTKTLADNRDIIEKVENDLAALMANRHSEKDLRAMLAYWESPDGTSYAQKMRAARDEVQGTTNRMRRPELTPEEDAAHKAYVALIGNPPLSDAQKRSDIIFPAANRIQLLTVQNFCDMRGPCPVEELERLRKAVAASP